MALRANLATYVVTQSRPYLISSFTFTLFHRLPADWHFCTSNIHHPLSPIPYPLCLFPLSPRGCSLGIPTPALILPCLL